MNSYLLKITHIHGLSEIVSTEIKNYSHTTITQKNIDHLYVQTSADLASFLSLQSALQVYLVSQNTTYNPLFLSKHKSIIGQLIQTVQTHIPKTFKTFSLNCAGSDSNEIKSIQKYIAEHFYLRECDDADMKIYIGKINTTWEIGVSISPRALSQKTYKQYHIPGGIHLSIAYAMNSLCELKHKTSYLNVFSGSATLLIEAALQYPHLSYVGIEYNKQTISGSIGNIRAAGLIKNISITHANIMDNPELGIFDVITADVPFGMQIGKSTDLLKLYDAFITYSSEHLNPDGILAIYTSETSLMRQSLDHSNFTIITELPLKIITSINSYLYPCIFICKKL